jgi:hypothetical protein
MLTNIVLLDSQTNNVCVHQQMGWGCVVLWLCSSVF